MADNCALLKISGRFNLPYHYYYYYYYYYYYCYDYYYHYVFNKPLRQFFILCFYVVPSSTSTAPPTEQTTKSTASEKISSAPPTEQTIKSTASEKISSTGNEKPEGKPGRSATQRRKGNQKTGLKNTTVKILFSLALLSGRFTALLLKIRLLCFFSF